MQEKYTKQRYIIWLSKDAVQKSDAAVNAEGFKNHSDFIKQVIQYYLGYIFEK